MWAFWSPIVSPPELSLFGAINPLMFSSCIELELDFKSLGQVDSIGLSAFCDLLYIYSTVCLWHCRLYLYFFNLLIIILWMYSRICQYFQHFYIRLTYYMIITVIWLFGTKYESWTVHYLFQHLYLLVTPSICVLVVLFKCLMIWASSLS